MMIRRRLSGTNLGASSLTSVDAPCQGSIWYLLLSAILVVETTSLVEFDSVGKLGK